jgi:hypothetical protein
MSIVTLDPGESLTAVLGGAITTTNPTYTVRYRDTGKSPDEVSQPTGSLNGTTAVTLVADPLTRRRHVESVQVYNADTVDATATVTFVGSSSVALTKVTLSTGDTVRWDNNGIRVVNSNGQVQSGTSAVGGVGAAAGTGVVATEAGNGALHTTTLTLTNAAVTLADEAGTVAYGGLKVYDMPAGAIQFLGALSDLDLTLSAAGVNADWDGDFGIGTVTASNNATLSSTEQDILPTTATPQAAASATTANGQSTITEAGIVIDGTSTAADVYLNILVDDADHDVTTTPTNVICNGTIKLVWVSLGDY